MHVGEFWPHGRIRFQPKWLTKAKILTRLRETLAMQQLSAECASKLRGDLMWMFSMCSRFLGKLAGPLLTAKQQHADPALNDEDLFTFRLLAQVVNAAQPREISIGTKLPEPLVVYSDASFEQGVLRLGWVIYPRDTDVLWFIDNEAAVSSLVKSTSKELDVHRISQATHALLGLLSSRCWFEWIDSDSNPADGLSREGLQDPVVLSARLDLVGAGISCSLIS